MKELFHHVCSVKENAGRFRPMRFTDWQIEKLHEIHPDYGENAGRASGASIMFYTAAEEISFSYKYSVSLALASGFDVYENGIMKKTYTLPTEDGEGVFTYKKESEGETLLEIFLPGNAVAEYWDFNLGDFRTISSEGKRLILFYGDSLTQSLYTRTPSLNFSQITSRMLDADYVNRGIGSLYYNASYLDENDTLKPDTVMVQFGANDLVERDENNEVVIKDGVAQFRVSKDVPRIIENAREYITKIKKIYKSAKIYMTTCIYNREILPDASKLAYDELNVRLCALSKELSVDLIDAKQLVPEIEECRVEDKVHFTALGGAIIAINLVKYLK